MNDEYTLDQGIWYHSYPVMDNEGNEKIVEEFVSITDVPVNELLQEWENLVSELSQKEVRLVNVKEEYNSKEFNIVFRSDIDFKALYNSTSEKVRKQHAQEVLSELNDKKESLELSVGWIKNYIPLLRDVIRTKQ